MSVMKDFINAVQRELNTQPKDKFTVEMLELTLDELVEKNPVVTIDAEGKALSYFNDNVWDFYHYKHINTNRDFATYKVTFTQSLPKELLNELKILTIGLFVSEYPHSLNARHGVYVYKSLLPIFNALNSKGLRSIDATSQYISLNEILSSIKGKYAKKSLKNSLGTLNKASNLVTSAVSFQLPIHNGKSSYNKGVTIESLAVKFANPDTDDARQTLYIPTDIHSQLVSNAMDTLRHAETLIDKIVKYNEDNYYHYKLSRKIAKDIKPSRTVKAVNKAANSLRRDNLRGLLSSGSLVKKYGLEEIKSNHGGGIISYCRLVAASAYIVISSFSGMRYDEVISIKRDGYNKTSTNPTLHFIRTFETKISGGEVVDYITSPIAEKAFEIIDKLHAPARKLLPELKDNEFLFIGHNNRILPTYKSTSSIKEILKSFVKHFNIKVSSEDMEQHRIFNTENLDKATVGKLWHLTPHQPRRTLVVNFLTHDLAGISQVKQQVKHLYAFMTQYYGKNSDLAKALKMRKSGKFQETLENELLTINIDLYKRLHYGDEPLLGEKGKSIVAERGQAEILTDHQIKTLFIKGAFKITRTPYGYCTKGDLCNKDDVIDPSFCGAKCDTMIITRDNALIWQKLYKRNHKLLATSMIKDFGGTETMMKAQNIVAKRIMESFKLAF